MTLETVTPLFITEIFTSIQGESTYQGLPTTFIRLSGCNLRCSWCDTPYSFKRGKKTNPDDIVSMCNEYGLRYVCITGGEPLLQSPVFPLMKDLSDKQFSVSIETGGSLSIKSIDDRVKIILDVKCPGSKMSHKNDLNNLKLLKPNDEIKFVIQHKEDYHFAISVCEKYSLFDENQTVLFSPVHGELDPKLLIEWILKDKVPARLNLQQHKYIWTPETRGV